PPSVPVVVSLLRIISLLGIVLLLGIILLLRADDLAVLVVIAAGVAVIARAVIRAGSRGCANGRAIAQAPPIVSASGIAGDWATVAGTAIARTACDGAARYRVNGARTSCVAG